MEIHWSLIILHREQFGATSSFFSSVITTKSVVVCFKTHPEPGAGRVSSFISFTTRVLLRLMLYYAHLEQIVTQRLKMYVKVLLKLLFTRSEKDTRRTAWILISYDRVIISERNLLEVYFFGWRKKSRQINMEEKLW